jgi:hypothetical protein
VDSRGYFDEKDPPPFFSSFLSFASFFSGRNQRVYGGVGQGLALPVVVGVRVLRPLALPRKLVVGMPDRQAVIPLLLARQEIAPPRERERFHAKKGEREGE